MTVRGGVKLISAWKRFLVRVPCSVVALAVARRSTFTVFPCPLDVLIIHQNLVFVNGRNTQSFSVYFVHYVHLKMVCFRGIMIPVGNRPLPEYTEDHSLIITKPGIMDRLKEAGYSSYRLRKEKLMGEATMTQIRKQKAISGEALNLLCQLLDCQPGDILEYIPDDPDNREGKS